MIDPLQTIPACPFCGHTHGYIDKVFDTYVVICQQCMAEGPQAPSREEAIEKWKTRK